MRNLALTVMVVLAVGCDRQQAPTAPSSTGLSVSGQVLDYSTNVGVSGAIVAFGNATTVTDTAGRYELEVPAVGLYGPLVDGVAIGTSRVTGSSYRGDFLVHPSGCDFRYGTLADAQTRQPVVGAKVSWGLNGHAVSEIDGWYRIDLRCPPTPPEIYSTGLFSVSHPNYIDPYLLSYGGAFGATRFDVALQRR
jgi:hypothetical protein